MKRHAAIEPIIGHIKSDHRMNRNYIKGADGNRNNIILAAAAFNFAKLVKAFYFYQKKIRLIFNLQPKALLINQKKTGYFRFDYLSYYSLLFHPLFLNTPNYLFKSIIRLINS